MPPPRGRVPRPSHPTPRRSDYCIGVRHSVDHHGVPRMAPTLKVLLADDEPLNALALRAQLETLGHEVIGPATDGPTAVELARDHPIDLAILDIRMPGLSGL